MIDFVHGHYRRAMQSSELLPLRKKTPGEICFDHRLEPVEGNVMVQVLGMEFYKVENGKEVLVKGSAVRILEAVRVEEGNKALRLQGNEEKEGKRPSCTEVSVSGEVNEVEREAHIPGCTGLGRPLAPVTGTKGSMGVEGNKEHVCFNSSTYPAPAGSLTLQELLNGQDAVAGFGMTRKREAYAYESG